MKKKQKIKNQITPKLNLQKFFYVEYGKSLKLPLSGKLFYTNLWFYKNKSSISAKMKGKQKAENRNEKSWFKGT